MPDEFLTSDEHVAVTQALTAAVLGQVDAPALRTDAIGMLHRFTKATIPLKDAFEAMRDAARAFGLAVQKTRHIA